MVTWTRQTSTFSKHSLHGRIAEELGKKIVNDEILPGDPLPTESEVCGDTHVSRTAYREAVKLLASKGMIDSRPKKGTTVKPRTNWNVLDPDVLEWIFSTNPDIKYAEYLYELRSIIEPAAAGLAAIRRTEEELATIEHAYYKMEAAGADIEKGLEPDLEFHRGIFAASGNELLSPMVYIIESALAELIKLSASNPVDRLKSMPFHKSVLEGIRNGNQVEAQTAMAYLISQARGDAARHIDSVNKNKE